MMIIDGIAKNIDAVRKLAGENHPNIGLAIIGNCEKDLSGVSLLDGSSLGFSFSEVETKKDEMQAEYDAQEYARKRQAEYPSIAELTVALYDTDDKADIEAKRAAVKAKYPKP